MDDPEETVDEEEDTEEDLKPKKKRHFSQGIKKR
jgi:hypothetical protein